MRLFNSILLIVLSVSLMLGILAPLTVIKSEAAGKTSESMLMDVRLDGPSYVGTGIITDVVLRISYAYPERIDNYTFRAELIDDLGDGIIAPDNGTAEDGIFHLKITGASTVGKMTIEINATANEGATTWYMIKNFDIDVVKPIFIDVTIQNAGQVIATNVTIKLIIDGELKSTQTVSIMSNTTLPLKFNWTFSTIQQGKHTVTIIIDDPSRIVEFSEGNNILTMDVYYAEPGNILRGVLAIGIMFVAFILIMTILQKKQAPKTK